MAIDTTRQHTADFSYLSKLLDSASGDPSGEGLSNTTIMSTSRAEQEPKQATSQTPQQPATRAVSNLRKDPPGACYQSTFATIEVGPDKKAYTVHKDLLAFYSDYFRAAFKGSFKEATESKISLHDECEDVFDIVNQFLYSRVIADGEGDKLSWDLLVRIWVFGDKYVVPTLQNAVVDLILKKRRLENAIPTSQVGQIWEKTMPSSPLRRFILDYMVYKRDLTVHKLNTDKWTYDALVDLVMAFANKKEVRKGRLPVQDICHYHIHKEGERC